MQKLISIATDLPMMMLIVCGAVMLLLITIIFILKKKCSHMGRGIKGFFSVLLGIMLIFTVAANGICVYYSSLISTVVAKSNASEEEIAEVTEESRTLVENIEDEGIVLLENKNNALPLVSAQEKKISMFGLSSVYLTYGGSGSGEGDETNNVDLKTGLENAEFQVNEDLIEFYNTHPPKASNSSKQNMVGGNYAYTEPEMSEFSEELLTGSREFSDVALIVIGRNGGEGGDLPMDMGNGKHYLELTSEEEALFEAVKQLDFEKTIVVIDSSNAMELGFLEDDAIDAAIWIGGPGATGCNSIGKVIAGEINPSGRLADTYAYDVTDSPAYFNAGDFKYSNAQYDSPNLMLPDKPVTTLYHSYVDYAEGIYVGYRYYETRWVDNETGKTDESAYDASVQYPFGYGLSYTSFEQKITGFEVDEQNVHMEVTVTNTGETVGKEVVQIYYTPPYYSGGIEKSHVVLAAFDKTDLLQPGETEVLKLTFAVEDMASYDYTGHQSYVLEHGEYEIRLMKNAHETVDSCSYTVVSDIVYDENHPRSMDETSAVNQFDDVSFGKDITYVSRADWEGTLPKERAGDIEADEALLDRLYQLDVENSDTDEDIVFADHGLVLADLQGLEYEDAKWDQLLEQLSVKDMTRLVGYGGYTTVKISSIDKPRTNETEGPAGVKSFMNDIAGVQYTSEVVLASTWNVDLAQEMGEGVGKEATVYGYDGMMAPAMNIHRTPFSGRNFEYYSEDGFLSGMMGAHVVKGLNEYGVTTYVKHFALNDQETNRAGICVWANEQSMRELYLKPFELTVKEGETRGMMSSFNRLGTTWAGGSYALLTTVLRDEWGFRGCVVSDMARNEYQSPDVAIRAGNDMMLNPVGWEPSDLSSETNTGRQALRRASHNILYAIVNSNAYETADRQSYDGWKTALVLMDVIVAAGTIVGFGVLYRKKKA